MMLLGSGGGAIVSEGTEYCGNIVGVYIRIDLVNCEGGLLFWLLHK